MRFGEVLRERRQQMGWTQQELGNLVGKTKNNISQYELGKREPDFTQLAVFARLFGVSVDVLLGDTPSEQRKSGEKLREQCRLNYDYAPLLLPVYDCLPLNRVIDRRYAAGTRCGNAFYFVSPGSAGRIRRGDLLLIEAQPCWTPGVLLLLAHRGEALLRTVKPCGASRLWLLPADQKAPPEMAARSEVTCIGRVLRAEFSLESDLPTGCVPF